MPPVSPGRFARALRGLPGPELAAFVAELWAARGWDTEVSGRTVVATREATTLRLLVPSPGRLSRVLPGWIRRSPAPLRRRSALDPSDHDAIVVPAMGVEATDGARVIDAAELREMALYAVDQDTRARLFERYVGCPPTTDRRTDGFASRVTSLPVVAAVGLLLVATMLGAAIHGGVDRPRSAVVDGPASAGSPGGSDATANGTSDASVTTVDDRYPPGVSADGIGSASAIVVSHLLELSSRPHRWELEIREVVDGETRGYVRETAWVENDTVYRSHVEHDGDVSATPIAIPAVSTYADGEVRYERHDAGSGPTYSRHILWPWGDPGSKNLPPFGDDSVRALEWYLSVEESRLVGRSERNGTRYYHLAGEGAPGSPEPDLRVTATVDEDGVVWALRAVERPADSQARIVVTFHVADVGNTTVTPPPWLAAARQAEGEGTSTPAPTS